MSKEGRKTLSTEETDRLNAALAMSALASGLSPVKVIEEGLTKHRATSCSATGAALQASYNMEDTVLKWDEKNSPNNSSISTRQTVDAQTEPLDLSSPTVAPKIIRERHDSGHESNTSPEPENESRTTNIIYHEPSFKSNVKFIQAPQANSKGLIRPGVIRPDNLSGLKPMTPNYLSVSPKNNCGVVSPVKSESELDSPALNCATTFAKWTAPFKPAHPRPLSSDCQSYSSSTSGYSSESVSEARSESEIESPCPDRLRSHLPPKKRKHIRHARNWDVELKKKSSPTPGTSAANEDDDVFTPTESPAKIEVGSKQMHLVVRPNSRLPGEKTIRINPKLIQEIQLAVTPDEEGDLPLHIAVVQENKDVIARVIPLMKVAGLSIDTPNALRQTPLHLAVITGAAEIVSYLIKQGAAPDFSDREGNTSLHLAVKHKQLDCLKVMLQDPTKFDINCKNFEGMTPLHVAVQEKSVDVTICLLDHGADIDCQDGKSGRTALHHAVEATCSPLVAELLKRNANVNQPSYSGCSPLHVASGRGHLDIVQLLVQYGADTTMRNFSVSVDNYQAAVQNTHGASGSAKSPSGGQKRNQKASVKRKLREKINT